MQIAATIRSCLTFLALWIAGCTSKPAANPVGIANLGPQKFGATPGIQLAPTTSGVYGPTGGQTVIPVGETILTDTLYIDGQFGPTLSGQGKYQSQIRWQGAPNPDGSLKPVIVIRNSPNAEISGFQILFDTPCSDAIVISNLPTLHPGTPITSACKIHDLIIDAGTNGNKWMSDAVRVDSGYFKGPDQNNEYHYIYDCKFANYSHAAVGIYSTQSHRIRVSNCEMSQSGAPSGIGVYARFSSMTMENCKGGNLNLVFFGSDQYAGAGKIINNNFENCRRFVDCRLPNGTWIIENNRCDGMNPFTCTYGDVDHVASYVHAYGSTTFKNNMFGCYNGGQVQLIFSGAIGLNCSGNTCSTNSTTPGPVMLMSQYPVGGPIAYWQNNRWTQGQLNGSQVIKQLVMPANTNVGLAQTTPQ